MNAYSIVKDTADFLEISENRVLVLAANYSNIRVGLGLAIQSYFRDNIIPDWVEKYCLAVLTNSQTT